MQNKVGKPHLTRRTFLKLGAVAASSGLLQAPAVATKAAGPKRGGTFTLAYTVGLTEFNLTSNVGCCRSHDFGGLACHSVTMWLAPRSSLAS